MLQTIRHLLIRPGCFRLERELPGGTCTHGTSAPSQGTQLNGVERDLVGLGSYIVNGSGDCNGCHSKHEYLAGGNPFKGQPAKIDQAHYLTGGQAFGPVLSANLTPDNNGLPGGMTLRQFFAAIRNGQDPDNPKRLLQVMPWPTYSHMQDRDIRAIYEYLRAIPSRGEHE